MADHYSDTCKPFRFTRSISIEGGWLKKPLVLPTTTIDDHDYVTVSRTNRDLAKVLGLDLNCCNPFAKTGLFIEIAKMRDEAVDNMILEHEKSNDPMNDGDATCSVPVRGRPAKVMAANVPQSIQLTYPAIIADNGERIDAYNVHVLTTPRRGSAVTLKLTESVLDWIVKAIPAVAIPTAGKRTRIGESELPPSKHKWRCRANQSPQLYCRFYSQEQKRWMTKAVAVLRPQSDELQEAEKQLDTFLVSNRVDDLEEDIEYAGEH